MGSSYTAPECGAQDSKTITYDEVTGKGAARIGFEQVTVERATEYSAEDADVTWQLRAKIEPMLARTASRE